MIIQHKYDTTPTLHERNALTKKKSRAIIAKNFCALFFHFICVCNTCQLLIIYSNYISLYIKKSKNIFKH